MSRFETDADQEADLTKCCGDIGVERRTIDALHAKDPDVVVFLAPGQIRIRSQAGHFDWSRGDYDLVTCERNPSHSHPRYLGGCRQCTAADRRSADFSVSQNAKERYSMMQKNHDKRERVAAAANAGKAWIPTGWYASPR